MPELPEVESARKQVEKASKGHKITSAVAIKDPLVFNQSPAVLKKALVGAKVVGSDRRGKYFWLKLDRKPWPVFHFGMSGRVEIRLKSETIKKTKQIPRLKLALDNGTEISFFDPRRFGRIRLYDDPFKTGPVSRLGFDPLFNLPPVKELKGILAKRKTSIKAVLLDQSVFAGVGNWIADEVLFQARISPHRGAFSLSEKQVSTLRQKILSVSKKAVSVGADSERFPKDWLFHVRWGKKKSLVLGHPMIHETVAGRTTAWVPELQD